MVISSQGYRLSANRRAGRILVSIRLYTTGDWVATDRRAMIVLTCL